MSATATGGSVDISGDIEVLDAPTVPVSGGGGSGATSGGNVFNALGAVGQGLGTGLGAVGQGLGTGFGAVVNTVGAAGTGVVGTVSNLVTSKNSSSSSDEDLAAKESPPPPKEEEPAPAPAPEPEPAPTPQNKSKVIGAVYSWTGPTMTDVTISISNPSLDKEMFKAIEMEKFEQKHRPSKKKDKGAGDDTTKTTTVFEMTFDDASSTAYFHFRNLQEPELYHRGVMTSKEFLGFHEFLHRLGAINAQTKDVATKELTNAKDKVRAAMLKFFENAVKPSAMKKIRKFTKKVSSAAKNIRKGFGKLMSSRKSRANGGGGGGDGGSRKKRKKEGKDGGDDDDEDDEEEEDDDDEDKGKEDLPASSTLPSSGSADGARRSTQKKKT